MTDIKQYEPLWGSWYVDEKLGEGSYGKVYKVHKEEFGRTYEAAVKIISIPQSEADILQAKSEGLNEESARSYFQAFVTDIIQEVDLMSAFRGNSNIVSLEDHKVIEKQGEIGWDIIIRMELLETLSSHITKTPLTQEEVVKLGVHICRALELCAKHNTIHRDIKPDNIFVSQYGDYKLGDFGIARQIERTMSGLSKKGTYQYMAPEVFKGNEYGASVDTYSLGIVMYRFLNKNRAPFLPKFPNPITPKDRDDALQRRMGGESLPVIPNISKELNLIVLKACAYERSERFKNATEMKTALESLPEFTSETSLPIVENSSQENDFTDDTVYSRTEFYDEKTDERTRIVFSRRETAPIVEQSTEENETEIKVSEKLIGKFAILSSVLFGILAVLTLFSNNKNDVIVFLPLYISCISQCFLKFKNKVVNILLFTCLIAYLLFSVLINFKIFDYFFMIIALSVLSVAASRKKKFQIADLIIKAICSIIFFVLIFNISQDTHYTYVAGTIAIPFLSLLSAPIALLLGSSESVDLNTKLKKVNTGIALLIVLQLLMPLIFVIYSTGYTKSIPLFYHVLNANFPGISLERFSWWKYGRFVGMVIQFFAFTSFLMLMLAMNIPKHFLYALHKENKRAIFLATLVIIVVIAMMIAFIF